MSTLRILCRVRTLPAARLGCFFGMAAGGKRKRVSPSEAAEPDGDGVTEDVNEADFSVRYAKLAELRETQPERHLREYIHAANDEVADLRAQCEEQMNTIAILTEKLKASTQAPAVADKEKAGLSADQQATANGKKSSTMITDETGQDIVKPPVATQAKPSRATGEIPSVSSQPVAEDKLKMLGILSGAVPHGTSEDEDGNTCFEYLVANAAGDRFVRFSLAYSREESSDPNGVIAYEPLDVRLPDTPPDLIFNDGLDFDAQHTSALLREILSYVLEKNTKQAMSSAKKSARKSRKSVA